MMQSSLLLDSRRILSHLHMDELEFHWLEEFERKWRLRELESLSFRVKAFRSVAVVLQLSLAVSLEDQETEH